MYRRKKILIIDDDVLIAEHLKTILESLNFKNLCILHNADDTYQALEKETYDLILLDINLGKKKEGLEIANKINETCKTPFLFITAYSEGIIFYQALSKHPKAIITKPFKKADIWAAINLVFMNDDEPEKNHLLIKEGSRSVNLPTHEIVYISSEGNYIDIVTDKKKYTVRKSLDWASSLLPQNNFMRIHRSYLINLDYVEGLKSNEVYMKGTTLPLARKHKEDLLEKIYGTSK